MAKPIKQIDKQQPTAMEEQSEAIAELMKVLADSREAMTKILEIIKELDNAGILDIAKGLLKTREDVGVIALEQLNHPGMQHIIKNIINAIGFLGSLNPSQLQLILNGIHQGLEQTTNDQKGQVGMWGLVKSLKDPEVMTSMNTLVQFLHGMGQGLEKKQVQ